MNVLQEKQKGRNCGKNSVLVCTDASSDARKREGKDVKEYHRRMQPASAQYGCGARE